MKNIIKLFALIVAFIMLAEALPLQAIDDMTSGSPETETAVEDILSEEPEDIEPSSVF